jgi:hypothetical protein
MPINECGLPIVVECESEEDCFSYISDLKKLGFEFGGTKGHFSGDTFVWVNLHNKTWAYGIPGIKLCEHFCNKKISLIDMLEIMRIFGFAS